MKNQDKKITAGVLALTALATLPIAMALAEEAPVTAPGETPVTVTVTPSDVTPVTTGVGVSDDSPVKDDKTGATDAVVSAPATPATDFVVDTSRWECKFCAFEEGYSGEVELGIGNVSDKSFKFGEYNGLSDEGGFFIANGKARYRDLDANYMDLSVQDLGLDSRSLNIEGGRQGAYKVFFRFDEIYHAISDSIMTPYKSGSTNSTLPSGWVTANTIAGMTALASSLQQYDVSLQRKRMDAGFSIIQASNWKYDFKYRHETRDGTKRSAGAILFDAAQMIEPINETTDQIDASASYIGKGWQATLAYYGSFFSNENKFMAWQNAFTPIEAGADTGQRALPPDNLFHQFILSAGYQITDKTRLSGDVSVGRMQQNEDFLPATINTSSASPSLPVSSLDGLVDTLHGNIRVISSINDKLRLNADYNYSDHDNQTPQSLYTWVHTDAFGVNPLPTNTNQPYSFTRQEAKVGGDYRVSKTTKLSAGVDYENFERTRQEVDKVIEATTWAKLIIRGMDFMDMTFKVAQAERDVSVSHYQVAPEIAWPQNPLMRKYNMADRSRTTAGANVYAMLSETFNVGAGIDYAEDDYSKSTLGLIDANELNLNIDASAILTDASSLHVFAGQERIESSQAGSQSFSNPTWTSENDDTVNTIGIGYKHQLMEDKLDVGVDYVISQSTGKIHITSATSEDFPDLEVDLETIKLYASYRMEDNMTLHAAYGYESYDTKNWALDNVNVDTLSDVLLFGEVTPSYNVSVITVSLRYKF
jgi:MtrB/PioB family decaheme-associated outer membrane protein